MTPEDWQILEHLGRLEAQNRLSSFSRDNLAALLLKTEAVMEHPEGYEGPCLCQLCCSYGD